MRPPIKEPATRKIRRCLSGPAGAEPGDEHGGDGGGDARPPDGQIDDVAERGAEADLEGEGDGLRLPEGSRNQERNLARGKGDELLVWWSRRLSLASR